MNDIDKQLKEALAENGDFDPEKTAAVKQTIVAEFGAKMRKVERILWAYLCVCLIVIFFSMKAFQQTASDDTRSLILYAIIFLVGFESTILIKIWYWVANTKVTLLKEIKLSRLAKTEQAEVGVAERPHRPGLSRREQIIWFLVMVVGSLLVTTNLLPAVGAHKADSFHKTYVALNTDGSGTATTKIRFRNVSDMPMTSFEFHAPATAEISWLDEQGREMPATAVSKDGQKHYKISLPAPLIPNEWFTYTRIMKSAGMAKKQEDGSWIYSADESYGLPINDFSKTVLWPEGAEAVTSEFAGAFEEIWKNERRIIASGRRGSNEPFWFAVKYRLPSEEKK